MCLEAGREARRAPQGCSGAICAPKRFGAPKKPGSGAGVLKAEAEKCSSKVCFHALRREENHDCCMQVAWPPKERRGPGSATTQKGITGSPAPTADLELRAAAGIKPTARPRLGTGVQKVTEGEEGGGRGENAATCAGVCSGSRAQASCPLGDLALAPSSVSVS